MLSQRQIRWNEFLSRFDFELIYRAGKKSGKPDILSRRSDHLFNVYRIASCCVIRVCNIEDNTIVNSILKNLKSDEFYNKVREFILEGRNGNAPFKKMDCLSLDGDGFLLFNNLIYVPYNFRSKILEIHHDSISAGHFGVLKTFELISRNFWWPKMRKDIKKFIKSCFICCKAKVPKHKPYGLLSPLSTPERPWKEISMDFIVELPKSREMTTIMVVVDRLTKMAHFIPLRCLPTASIAADSFINNIFRLHGFPDSIISDRGSQFTSEFWKRMCKLLDINHSLSTANHPQTDGQTERVNGILEQYLRCFINERQTNWVDILPFAEFSYNNTIQQSTKQSPFFSNYGFNPKFSPEIPSFDNPNNAEKRVIDIENNIKLLKENLNNAKKTYKKYADKRRLNAPNFEVGQQVWLYKGLNVRNSKKKLADQMMGPFTITKKVSPLAFELDLPSDMRCHPVFHVSLLEPYHENEFKNRSLRHRRNIHLTVDSIDKIPDKIVDMKTYKGETYYLMSWKGNDPVNQTWIKEEQVTDKQLIQQFLRRSKKGKDSEEEEFNNDYYIRHKPQHVFINIEPRKL